MILNPIIPIWLMSILSIVIIIFLIKKFKQINKKSILRISIIIILFIINLRPMIKIDNATVSKTNLNILLVIDTTLSMNAEDISPTRLEQVKKDCEYIINTFPNAYYSLITFNNDVKLQIPFTSDSTIVKNTISVLKTVDNSYANKSSLNIPQEKILNQLESIKEKNNYPNIIFFISDGEITKNETLESYKNISKYVDNGAVLGYGTEDGGYMQYTDYYGEKSYVKYYDSNYREVKGVSKIDEDNLKKIAKDIGIEYINMEKQSNIDKILKDLNKTKTSSLSESNIDAYEDIYYIFVLPLIIIFFLIYKEYKEEYSL